MQSSDDEEEELGGNVIEAAKRLWMGKATYTVEAKRKRKVEEKKRERVRKQRTLQDSESVLLTEEEALENRRGIVELFRRKTKRIKFA